MIQKSAIFDFPKSLVNRPIISELIKDCDIEVNILQARITPREDGHMFAILRGPEADVGMALDYLAGIGVRTTLPAKNLILDEDRCVHCGACVGQCLPSAFFVDPETQRVVFDSDKCIACGLCIPACSYRAIESITEHLRKKGEL